MLALYQHSVEQYSRRDGWQLVPASDATMALPDGKSALLWRMQKQPPDPAQPGGLTLAAALNRGNVVALVGSTADAADQPALDAYLRAALLTLRPEQPVPPPAQGDVLNAGANLRQGLELLRLMFGEEARALVNRQLMTEADNDLPLATPVKPDVLMLGLRRALEDAGDKAMVTTVVFDGRSAHVLNVRAYDAKADAFTYWDPWGKGSFLGAGSNAAGVAATPHPTERRLWIVKADQLKRVVYAVELEGTAIEHVAAEIPLGAFGALGDTIQDAQQTDLFTWFHLQQIAVSKNAAGHPVVTFRPTAPQFRLLASLDVTTDATGRILAADLRLLRNFIDDKANTVFARDLANSFLRSATPARDMAWLEPLANQLRYAVQGRVFIGNSQAKALPEHPTDDYLTFLGKQPETKTQLSLTMLTLTNTTIDEKPGLVISLGTVR
ncbi:MAG TPA: hypothetical protein VGI78_15485 [Acetobacteraceae bacterium]